MPFAELFARSSFSFLEGASQPEEMVQTARELGLAAIALCDRDGLYGMARAHAEAKRLNQKLLIGAEVTIDLPPSARHAQDPRAERPRIALISRDHTGYSNLCTLLTEGHAEQEKGEFSLPFDALLNKPRGLFAIVPADADLAQRHVLGSVVDAFGEHAFLAIWRHGDARDAERTALARRAEAYCSILPVATSRPRMHHPERKRLLDILTCIRYKTTLAEAGSLLQPNQEAFLRSPEEMMSLFRDLPDAVERTVEIADACQFSLDELTYHFPSEALCLPGETPKDTLRRLVQEGCERRYPRGTPEDVALQIEKELALIHQLRKDEYFLSAHQIVAMARERKILCQGRGSAANSAVCFVLGVTAVDPARASLLFERFLSAERDEPPDIDIDFEHERREEIIQALYAMYGRDRAAMVSEVISYRGKSALREVGKAMGLSLDQLDRLSKLGGYGGLNPHDPKHLADMGLDPDDRRLRLVLELSNQIQKFPRHLSIHVGGFVLSSESLLRIAPIEPARMEGRTVIPWDKDDIDELGFFKVDVLGLGMLTAIRKTLALLHEGPPESFDPIEAMARIPPEDPAVYEAICQADTIGVFQIESRAQMSMLPRLRPKKFYDLVVEVAIVRPGPIQGGMVHPYLRRREGREDTTPPHPCLAPILDRTLGVPLFQEQVMQIAMVGAGYTPGEADQLRRDMAAWRRNGRLERHRNRLIEGFTRRGISLRFAEALYKQIQGFGEYGFPESHAASFAVLVYVSAWLKLHHPDAFACALLNSQPMGFYSPSSIVKDAERHGVSISPVCVLRSDWDHGLEAPPTPGRFRALRLGFRLIKGFSEKGAQALLAARSDAPFTSVQDLALRARLPRNEMDALAEAGAFDAISPARREAMWRGRALREGGLFDGVALEPDRDIGLPPMKSVEQMVLDYARVGLSIADHPMKHLRDSLERRRVTTAIALKKKAAGARVAVAGLVIGRQRPETASGVTFMTLEDETGMINLIVHREVFDSQFQITRYAELVLVTGRVERQAEVVHVLAKKFERLELPDGERVPARSRDFH